MSNFYHIFAKPKTGVTQDDISRKIDLALDWFRYSSNIWIIYTTKTEDEWYERLSSLVKPDGSLFICRLDIEHHQGWMTTQFWDWLKEIVPSIWE